MGQDAKLLLVLLALAVTLYLATWLIAVRANALSPWGRPTRKPVLLRLVEARQRR